MDNLCFWCGAPHRLGCLPGCEAPKNMLAMLRGPFKPLDAPPNPPQAGARALTERDLDEVRRWLTHASRGPVWGKPAQPPVDADLRTHDVRDSALVARLLTTLDHARQRAEAAEGRCEDYFDTAAAMIKAATGEEVDTDESLARALAIADAAGQKPSDLIRAIVAERDALRTEVATLTARVGVAERDFIEQRDAAERHATLAKDAPCEVGPCGGGRGSGWTS
jgi:hypothetical protein